MAHPVFRKGATALITGGASGVGFAIARICRSKGMNLALLDISSDNLSKASLALSDSSTTTETYTLDVGDNDAWASIKSKVESSFPSGIDLLMLNAGASFKSKASDPDNLWSDSSYFQQTYKTNVFGVINGVSTFLGDMLKGKGDKAIIITGSKQGITNPPGDPAYNSSKATLKALAEHLSNDLRTKAPNITVHLLIPGWTFTGLSGNVGPSSDEEAKIKKPEGAWFPSQVAEYGVKKMGQGSFYIVCPDNDVTEELDQARMTWGAGDVIEDRSALSRWDAKYKDQSAKWIADEAERRKKEGHEGRGDIAIEAHQ